MSKLTQTTSARSESCRGKPSLPKARRPSARERREEARIERENEQVVLGMQNEWPEAADWNYVDDDHVEILDKDDKVLAVIDSYELTHFWNF